MAEARQNRIGTSALWIAAGIALILIFFGVRRMTRERLPLRVAEGQVQDLVKTISTNGKIEPQDNFAAHAPYAAIVDQLYVHAGEQVPKGKLMLSLNDTDARSRLASATAGLRGAEAALHAIENGGTPREQVALTSNIAKAQIEQEQAERDLAAVRKLEAQGAASPSEVAQAQQRLAIAKDSLSSLRLQQSEPFAKPDLAHARSAVAEAQAAYSAAAQAVAQANVRAPFPGTVYSLPVARYDYVEPGAELLQMADPAKLRVRAYFDEPEIGDLKLGNPVTIVWDAKPGITWHGRIIRLPSTIITYGTRNVGEVLVSVEDADGLLLPNTNVVVTVTTQQVRDALTVPREALHIENGRDYIYVVSGGALRREPVQVGAINLTEVQILSGLKEHSMVALGTTNGAPVSEGLPVTIVN